MQNALSYASHFSQIFIVDNSEGDNSTLASQIPNAVYLPNGKNLGIARALNQGIETALIENGKGRDYRWVLTMDQDSAWEKEQLEKYIALCIEQSEQDETIKSFAPESVNSLGSSHSTLGVYKRRLYKILTKKEYNDFGFIDRTITSGNVIEIEAWQKVGRFEEVLFIDEVDHDFCYRLREGGFKIFKSRIQMHHQTKDNSKQPFFPEKFKDWSKNSPMRLFYIFRNRFFVAKKYPWAAKEFHYKTGILRLAIRKCIFDKKAFSNIKILIRAHRDYRQTLLPLIQSERKKTRRQAQQTR